MSLSLMGEALEIRIAYAQAKIGKLLFSSDVSSDEMNAVIWAAEAFGHSSYCNGMHEPPALIQGEPALLQAWQFGYDLAEEAAEMAECSSCQDGTGNPCLGHG